MLQRLRDIRKTLGYTQTDFAKCLGITQTAYSMIENGIRPLSDKYIRVICMTFNISQEFLLAGQGKMFESSPYEKELIRLFTKLLPETQEYLLVMARELLITQQKLICSDPWAQLPPPPCPSVK